VLLRVEEDLGPAHAGAGRPGQVGHGELMEVSLGAQHRDVAVVQVKERLQAGEPVLGPELIGARHRHPVAPAQLDQQFRFQGAFDVNVKFCFGQHAHSGCWRDRAGPGGRLHSFWHCLQYIVSHG
jgi:hypothetical protein